MRLLLAPSILFKASICSGKEQGSAGKAAFVRQCHLFLGLQTAKPELRGCTPVRAVPELHSASSTGQDSPAPGIWGIKKSQEKKLLFFFLNFSAFGWGQKAPAHMGTDEFLQICFQTNRSGTAITHSIAAYRPLVLAPLSHSNVCIIKTATSSATRLDLP